MEIQMVHKSIENFQDRYAFVVWEIHQPSVCDIRCAS